MTTTPAMLDPKTAVYRFRQRSGSGLFHFKEDCRTISNIHSAPLKGTLGGCLASGRRMCKACGVDPARLPPVPIFASPMRAVAA